jgi:hypothetical protein
LVRLLALKLHHYNNGNMTDNAERVNVYQRRTLEKPLENIDDCPVNGYKLVSVENDLLMISTDHR